MAVHRAILEQEAFYQECIAGMKVACVRHPSIRNMEIIGCLARMLSYCITACYQDERDIAGHTVMINMEKATKDVAKRAPHGWKHMTAPL